MGKLTNHIFLLSFLLLIPCVFCGQASSVHGVSFQLEHSRKTEGKQSGFIPLSEVLFMHVFVSEWEFSPVCVGCISEQAVFACRMDRFPWARVLFQCCATQSQCFSQHCNLKSCTEEQQCGSLQHISLLGVWLQFERGIVIDFNPVYLFIEALCDFPSTRLLFAAHHGAVFVHAARKNLSARFDGKQSPVFLRSILRLFFFFLQRKRRWWSCSGEGTGCQLALLCGWRGSFWSYWQSCIEKDILCIHHVHLLEMVSLINKLPKWSLRTCSSG